MFHVFSMQTLELQQQLSSAGLQLQEEEVLVQKINSLERDNRGLCDSLSALREKQHEEKTTRWATYIIVLNTNPPPPSAVLKTVLTLDGLTIRLSIHISQNSLRETRGGAAAAGHQSEGEGSHSDQEQRRGQPAFPGAERTSDWPGDWT